MQLVSVGRNAACPCGSGRKYKVCCLGARDEAVVGGEAELDVRAVVDAAIASDNWDAVHDHVAYAIALFQPGQPLEHVRFRSDVIRSREPDAAELARWCTPGWLRWCEIEIAYVLARFELAPEQRDGLRMAVHLLRRFGAGSPVLEELSGLQVDENVDQVRRLAELCAARGVTVEDLGEDDELDAWIGRVRPELLSFVECGAGWGAASRARGRRSTG